jgi:hypothetical protein
MEVTCTSGTLILFYKTTRRQIAEGINLRTLIFCTAVRAAVNLRVVSVTYMGL